jgi:hypothetical protein
MAFVNHWIAIDETGRGAIGLTREAAVAALPGARTLAIATYAVWDLSAAMIRGGTLPIQFDVERRRLRTHTSLALVPRE